MKKTCGLFVAGVVAAAIVYFILIRCFLSEIHLIPSIGLAILGGFSLLAIFGALSGYIQSLSDKNVITRALTGKPFVDGKRAAAIGRIDASGLATLTAPFSERDCLA